MKFTIDQNCWVIESPDLILQRRQEDAKTARLQAAKSLVLGTEVKAGPNGKPGILESISPEGFASIRWDSGLLCGVECDRIEVV